MAHARINVEKAEDVKMFIKSVEDNIMGFHVHWNDGNNDSHLPLKQGVHGRSRELFIEFKSYTG